MVNRRQLFASLAGLLGCAELWGIHDPALDPTDPDSTCTAFGARRCAGQTLQSCNNELRWDSLEECEYLCRDGACSGECWPAELGCSSSGAAQRCNSDGIYEDVDPCEGRACVDGACTGRCKPNTVRCDPDSNDAELCDEHGEWQVVEVCEDRTCLGGACQGRCTDGRYRCEPSALASAGVRRQLCVNGDFESSTSCPFLCDTAACTDERDCCDGVCVPTATECIDTVTLQTCDGAAEWVESDCGERACVGSPARCAGECRPGARQCNRGNISECSSEGTWVLAMGCAQPSESCQLAASGPACAPNPAYSISVLPTTPVFDQPFSIDTLYLSRLRTRSEPAELLALLVDAPTIASAAMRVALYSEEADLPAQLLFQSDVVNFGPGRVRLEEASCTLLRAETNYWIGVLLSADTTWAFGDLPDTVLRLAERPFGAGFPSQIGTTSASSGLGLPVGVSLQTLYSCE